MTIIQNRQDTSTNWTRINPVLVQGELGIEIDTNKFKIGDGVTAWKDLAYPIPTKTSQLINDSGFLNVASIPSRTSQLVNDSGFLTSHQDISNKADRATTLAGYGITDSYTREQIDGKLSAAMRYKGTVATPYDLPVNPEVGDTYNIEDTGANYAWNGISWDKLSENIDLSDYALKSNIPTKTSDLINDSNFVPSSTLNNYALKNSIPSKTSDLINDSEFVSNSALQNYATKTDLREKQTIIDNLDNRISTIENTQYIGSNTVDVTKNGNNINITTKTFVFEQAIASEIWDITHNMNKYPYPICVDSTGAVFEPAWEYPKLQDNTLDKNRIILTMNGATTGKAFLN